MRFALIDGVKVEASKGAKGFCQSYGAEMIAKCGEFKINHWSHKKNDNVILGGKGKLNGIANGKENFHLNGRKIFTLIITQMKNT